MKDQDRLVIKNGYVVFPDGKDADLCAYFLQWRNRQAHAFGLFHAPKDQLEAVKAAIVAAGGVVMG
ncbi:hypothetical protein [Polaromonas sp.]|uniref:hypothetical protein n=1 Tax=Polaromonas sp. TaxID=1869339 RepID=UPI003BB6E1EF